MTPGMDPFPDRAERHVLAIHLAFALLCAAALGLPLAPLGWRILALVLFYNILVPVTCAWRGLRDPVGLWLFLAPLSAFQVLPDAFLASVLGVLVFPDLGVPRIGGVSVFMAGMWTIPLFLTVFLARSVASRRGAGAGLATASVVALILFVGSEATLWRLSIWEARDVMTLGHVALYVVVPEVLLGVATYAAFEAVRKRLWTWRIGAAAAISVFYLGALGISYFLVERPDLRMRPAAVDREAVTSTSDSYEPTLETPDIDPSDPEVMTAEAYRLIRFEDRSSALRRRHRLIDFLWGAPGPPRKAPIRVANGFFDERASAPDSPIAPHLERLDRVRIDMHHGMRALVYDFVPKEPNGQLVLVHQGHLGDVFRSAELIGDLLAEGYRVGGFTMPLVGINSRPVVVRIPGVGHVRLERHEDLSLLRPEHGHPVRYFIEPVVTFLDYLAKNAGYSEAAMVGLSGGGWTTILAAAIDPRIHSSVPVAASTPIYQRAQQRRDWGDWEQTVPELYQTANYLELSVLGALEPGRRQMQVVNAYDPCCFGGDVWRTWEPAVSGALERLGGGSYSVHDDTTHTAHAISEDARGRIVAFLRDRTDARPKS